MGSLTCFRREHWSWQAIMAALPPKADICGALPDVCFGPKADIPTSLRTNHCAAKMKALNMLDNAASKAILQNGDALRVQRLSKAAALLLFS
jgi:hypothetical protein